tara:strand:- start:711 stop:896 length:186 start_codon:yes stop_codon:yes gene_type:complete
LESEKYALRLEPEARKFVGIGFAQNLSVVFQICLQMKKNNKKKKQRVSGETLSLLLALTLT